MKSSVLDVFSHVSILTKVTNYVLTVNHKKSLEQMTD